METPEYDDDGFEEFPDGWEDAAIVSSIKRNRNGSITCRIMVLVTDDEGNSWDTFRTIRLDKQK